MARRVSSPTFIGRSNELDALTALADMAASGRLVTVLVGGEAGVGKTRLVSEFAGDLRARDWLVLEGGSVALDDEGLPFEPIVEALRGLMADTDPETVASLVGPGLQELTPLVPELAGNGPRPPTRDTQAAWRQIQIFEGILRLLRRLSVDRPVAMLLEDLHWADRSTRDLLAFLARNARDERLLIVTTFRTDELQPRHPLTRWIAEIRRDPRTERLDLGRFARPELDRLITAILGDPPPPEMLDSIAQRSDGNAFFTEELLAALDPARSPSGQLPSTLRDVLLVRLGWLSVDATRLLEVAAVGGRQVDDLVLREVCRDIVIDRSSALHESIDAHWLVLDRDGSGERYRFRHALGQEAVYEHILLSERHSLHAAYAAVIEAGPTMGGADEASRQAQIAYHWSNSASPGRALGATLAAADASRAMSAFAEAARLYESAIDLWEIVPVDQRPDGRDLGDLLDAASIAASLVGDATRAVGLARRQVELVDGANPSDDERDRERRARARERLGLAEWLAGDTEQSIHLLEEAVDLLDGLPVTTLHARVLAGLAGNLMLAGRSNESVPFAKRAIETARLTGVPAIEARATEVLGVDLATLGRIGDGIALLEHVLEIADPAADPTAIPRAHANLGSVQEMGGHVQEALTTCLAGAEAIRRDGTELGFLTFLEVNAAAMLIELGRYREAGELLARHDLRALPGVPSVHVHLTRVHLAIRMGDLALARRHLAAAESEGRDINDAQFVVDRYAFGTEIASWDDDPVTALAIAHQGLAQLAEIDDGVIEGQLAIPAVRAAADLAVRARTARDPVEAGSAVRAANEIIGRYRASTARLADPDALARHEIGWRMDLCTAELARGVGDDDPERWLALRSTLSSRPAPFLEAYVLWRAADAQASSRTKGAASQTLVEAHTIAVDIGAALLLTRIEGLARRLRVDLPEPRPASVEATAVPPVDLRPAPPRVLDPFGLTEREREVLGLVAEGYTNRRIAETLFISESTAGVHVSHILAKLDVDTRTEAAAIAVRVGLDRSATS